MSVNLKARLCFWQDPALRVVPSFAGLGTPPFVAEARGLRGIAVTSVSVQEGANKQ
jgi:glycerol kinase